MGFRDMHSTQVGLVLNLLTGSISPHFHVLFNEILYTVVISTTEDPEVWIRLFTPRNSRIQVMLYQKDHLDLDDEWLTTNDQLTHFSKSREQIMRKVKGSDSPNVQGTQYFEEYLVVRERVPSRTERLSVRKPGTNGNHALIGQEYKYGSSANRK